MDKYEKKILEADLTLGLPCAIDHGSGEFLSVTYIIQSIGYTGQTHYEITIPICQICAERLESPGMVLLYCLRCSSNKWIAKPLAKLDYYDKHICWMSCCPECAHPGEKANIYFTD